MNRMVVGATNLELLARQLRVEIYMSLRSLLADGTCSFLYFFTLCRRARASSTHQQLVAFGRKY